MDRASLTAAALAAAATMPAGASIHVNGVSRRGTSGSIGPGARQR